MLAIIFKRAPACEPCSGSMMRRKIAAGDAWGGMTEGGGSSSPDVAADTTGAQGFTKEAIGAATSKLISASIGDITVLFSRSPKHRHYSLADLEWLVLPAVFSGQFFIAEASHAETGHRAPVAVVTWARVSADVDQKLTATVGQPFRLRPDEWSSGDILWLIDAVGDPGVIVASLKTLLNGSFKDHDVKVATVDAQGAPRIEMVRDLVAKAHTSAGGAR